MHPEVLNKPTTAIKYRIYFILLKRTSGTGGEHGRYKPAAGTVLRVVAADVRRRTFGSSRTTSLRRWLLFKIRSETRQDCLQPWVDEYTRFAENCFVNAY